MTTYHHVLHPPRRPSRRVHRQAGGGRAIVAHRDPALRERIAGLLRRDGFDVAAVRDGYAVVRQLAAWTLHDGRSADVVLAGTALQGWTGIELSGALPTTEWNPSVMLVLDREESAAFTEAGLVGQPRRPFICRVPFEDEDLRTVALFLLRSKRASTASIPRQDAWPEQDERPDEPPREHEMHDDSHEGRRRKRIELEINVFDAAPFDEIFDLTDDRVAELEPCVAGAATCVVTVRRSSRVKGAFEAHVQLTGSEQMLDVRRRSHTPVGALRNAFAELRMRARRPRSGVEMRMAGLREPGAATGEDQGATG